MSEFDDIARELHATRGEPDPEFARELDRRAAEWLRERPRRRLPPLRIAIPAMGAAAAAAAVVVAVVVSGGEERTSELEVAVVRDQGATEALGTPLENDTAARKAEGGLAPPAASSVDEGEPVRIRYFLTAPAEGTVRLAGREAPLDIAAGSGRLEISTEGLPAGAQRVEIALPPLPPYRERIEIGP